MSDNSNAYLMQQHQRQGDLNASSDQKQAMEMQNLIEQKHKKETESSSFTKNHAIYTSCVYAKPHPTQFREQAIVSSLFLQKLMYFNAFYSFVNAYFLIFCCFYRFKIADSMTGSIILIVIVCVWILFEWFRLNNGYSGNINETFPEFVSFILLTIANIGLSIAYLIVENNLVKFQFPIELICLIIEIIFLVLQLVACFGSIGSIVKAQLLNRKAKKKKEKAIEIEQFYMLEDKYENDHYQEEEPDDIDEKNPYVNSNNNGGEGAGYYNDYDGPERTTNYQRRRDQQSNYAREDQDYPRRRGYDENQDPQASNAPYNENYNSNFHNIPRANNQRSNY